MVVAGRLNHVNNHGSNCGSAVSSLNKVYLVHDQLSVSLLEKELRHLQNYMMQMLLQDWGSTDNNE